MSCQLVLKVLVVSQVSQVADVDKVKLYAHWDELQRYMDVSQPLHDVPPLEKYRHLDPTTAEYDAAGKL